MDLTLVPVLADLVVKLFEKKESNIAKFFDMYVQPAYDTAEKVYLDYLQIFVEIKKKLADGIQRDDLIHYIESERIKYLPIRQKIREEIQNRFLKKFIFDDTEAQIISNNRGEDALYDYEGLGNFEKGILGILIGGIAPFSTTRRYRTPYGGQHTLLDVLSYVRQEKEHLQDFNRSTLIHLADYQMENLEKAWKDVAMGYAEYKLLAVPTPPSMKKKS